MIWSNSNLKGKVLLLTNIEFQVGVTLNELDVSRFPVNLGGGDSDTVSQLLTLN